MLSQPHPCALSDIALAAKTIASVMIVTNPLIQFVYDKPRPPPPLLLPRGKLELFTVHLYQTLTNGLILTVDNDDDKCVGVAVWTSPNSRPDFFGKLRAWCISSALYIWLVLSFLYYGSEMNETVSHLRSN